MLPTNLSILVHKIGVRNNETVPPTSIDARFEFAISLSPFVLYSPTFILFAIGVPANFVIIYYLFRSGKYKTQTFCTITSLAMADFLTCLSWALQYLFTYPSMPRYVPDLMCALVSYLSQALLTVSIYHLLLFSAIRFYQLIYPLTSKVNLTRKLITSLCVATWITCLLVFIPRLFLFKTGYINIKGKEIRVCDFHGDQKLRDILSHCLTMVAPAILMMTLHGVKFFKVNKTYSPEDLADKGRKGTVHKAMYVMIFAFFATWLPSLVHDMAHEAFGAPYLSNHVFWYFITNIILSLNNCANPYIYMLMAKPIREDILNYICPAFCRECKKNP